jgi:hypothetical protein
MKLSSTLRSLAAVLALTISLFATGGRASVSDGASDAGSGWMESPWLGYYCDVGGNWLYATNWGWLFEYDSGTGSAWLYAASESGWYWTGESVYPYVYRDADSSWAWYWSETSDPRLYYEFSSASWAASDGSDGTLWRRYFLAVEDASVAEKSEISHDLIAINDYNDALPWNDAHTGFYVVSWMPGTYIGSYVVGSTITPTWDIWVTVSGEAQTAAEESGLCGDALLMRMKEYIGLPPDKTYSYWVEFLVSPEDLFRPGPDPDPGCTTSTLDFPDSTTYSVGTTYRAWFAENEAGDYVLTRNGYPWTRLGYTYDWGCDTSEVGLSEFVIRQGSTVLVTHVYTNDEYLGVGN